MMHLAGNISVPLVGRVFSGLQICGFLMPSETPLEASRLGSREERIGIIHQLRDLVAHMHSNIKPRNLLLCDADGREVRLRL
ncbi:hypothetical protein C8R44DRAFT_796848 [Mycena epipterygia]|nr:hypothetical protein C8R44DRAFT_796848 [Mycena epipterygia]